METKIIENNTMFELSENDRKILFWGLESLINDLKKAGEILTGELIEECNSRKSRAESLLYGTGADGNKVFIQFKDGLPF